MDAGVIRDLMIIILFSLLTIIIIGAAVGAFIAYRKAKSAMETAERPLKAMQQGLAFVKGSFKGIGDAFNIIRGKEVKDE